jgi:tetratricopeptide (TPR) repeat protein
MRRLLQIWWKEIAMAAVVFLAAFVAVALVLSTLRLNLREMEIHMRTLEQKNADQHNAYLVARFVRQYRVYQHLQSQAESDRAELRVGMLARLPANDEYEHSVNGWMDGLNLKVQNVLRGALGSPPIASRMDSPSGPLLDNAYAYEQSQDYSQALDIYASIPRDPLTDGLVWLHEGFCLAVQGEFDIARSKLRQVTAAYRDQPIGGTAATLLGYLDLFVQEKNRVLATKMRPAEKAARLAMLFQCGQNTDELEKLARQAPDFSDRLYYLQGRCLEERGQKKAAVHSYIRVLRNSGDASLLVDANRRIFMTGGHWADSGQNVQRLALELNAVLQDTVLREMQKMQSQFVEPLDSLAWKAGDATAEWESEALALRKRLRKVVVPQRKEPVVAVVEAPPARAVDEPPVQVSEPEPEPVTAPAPVYPKGSRVRVFMNDGKRHVGVLQTPSDAEMVQLKTDYWMLGLVQGEIRTIELEKQ